MTDQQCVAIIAAILRAADSIQVAIWNSSTDETHAYIDLAPNEEHYGLAREMLAAASVEPLPPDAMEPPP